MGRRLRLKPAPDPHDLGSRTVHEVIRDYPEALVALRRARVDVAREGGRPLRELGREDEVMAAILEATAWRPDPHPAPSTGTVEDAAGDAMVESDEVPPTPGGP